MRFADLLSRRLGLLLFTLSLVLQIELCAREQKTSHWVGSWATSPMAEESAKLPITLAGGTLRQVIHTSIGGSSLRLRLTNTFGSSPLVLKGVHVALASSGGAIKPESDAAVLFGGKPEVSIPAGATYLSDPLVFNLPDQSDLAISLLIDQLPATTSGHGGSRTHAYFQPGDWLAAPSLPTASKMVHWCFLKGLDVLPACSNASALVLLGDSITDGYGTTTDTNQRWPDELVRRLQKRSDIAPLGTLNVSIGGNRVLREGNGPSALVRLERDVLTQAGARWLVVFIGINDIGTRLSAQKLGEPFASAEDLILAYEQILTRARDAGLRVLGATITPYEGNDNYWCVDGEAARLKVNDWIRNSAHFDAVLDFDLALRDPEKPSRLNPVYDCGDHLHPSIAGYKKLAESVDLDLFKQ